MKNSPVNQCSPPLLMRQYFRNLELLENLLNSQVIYEGDIKNIAMMSLFMSVAAVEAFLNMFFRILVEEERFQHLKADLIEQIENRSFSLEKKIRKWPEKFFHKNFYNSEAGKAFREIKDKRNELMHYFPTVAEIGGFPYPFNKYGMTDSTVFYRLPLELVRNVKVIVKNVMNELFEMAGYKGTHSYFVIENWTGEMYSGMSKQ